MSKQTDSQGREVFSVHPAIRQEAARYRTTTTRSGTQQATPEADSPPRDAAERAGSGEDAVGEH